MGETQRTGSLPVRLRSHADHWTDSEICREAVTEIDSLQARVTALEGALEAVAPLLDGWLMLFGPGPKADAIRERVRAALSPTSGDSKT